MPTPLDVVKCNYCKKKLQLCYNAILNVELYCSTIAKVFAILGFYKSKCDGDFALLC